MPSLAVSAAFNARLGDPWNGTGIPVGTMDRWPTPPDVNAFIVVQYPVVNGVRPGIGRRFFEEGAARIVLNVKREIGIDQGLTWADTLATLFRAVKFSSIQTFEPSPPIIDDNIEEGNWLSFAVIVPYRYQFNDLNVGPLQRGIKTDYDALDRTDIPNPTTNFGGSRFYGLNSAVSKYAAVEIQVTGQITVNFGGSAFANAPPSGFSAWGASTTLDPSGARLTTFTNGNLTVSGPFGAFSVAKSTTAHSSGKWYFEATIDAAHSDMAVGLWNGQNPDGVDRLGNDGNSIVCFGDGLVFFGLSYPGATGPSIFRDARDSIGATFTNTDLIGVAVDLNNSKIWYRRNGGAWKCQGTSQAFGEFKYFGQAQAATPGIVLDLEGGTYETWSFDSHIPWAGIKNLTVEGDGATFVAQAGYAWDLGSHAGFAGGSSATDTHSVRLQSVSPGDQVLTIALPIRPITDLEAEFQAGDWCCLAACELQGHAGYPPNPFYLEYVQIESVSGDEITLTAPVTGTYLSTFPDRYVGVSDGYDPGGAATLHKMIRGGSITPLLAWNMELEINGLTIDQTAGIVSAVNFSGRDITQNNVTWIATSPNFSAAKRYRMRGGSISFPGFLTEIDKSIEDLEFTNVVFHSTVQFQSSSINIATFTNCEFQAKFQGQARTTILTDCSIAEPTQGLFLGNSYGQGGTLALTNVSAQLVSCSGSQYINEAELVYADGVFTSPSGNEVFTLAVPGLGFLGFQARKFGIAFNILSITTDVDNKTVITTDLPYPTLPSPPGALAGPWRIWWHPCQSMTCSGGTVSKHLVEWNDSYAQNKPAFCYLKRTFGPSTANVQSGGPYNINAENEIFGRLVSITINVTRPYTGAQPTALFCLEFEAINDALSFILSNHNATVLGINTKIAGSRVITANAITGSQSGDTFLTVQAFTLIEGVATILTDGFSNFVSMSGDTLAQTPIIEIIMELDQTSQFS